MLESADNPFTPGPGRRPPLVAGRERELAALTREMNRVVGKKPGNFVVMCGPRGNGKTVLLLELKARAEASKANVRRLTAENLAGDLAGIAAVLSDGADPDGGAASAQMGFTGNVEEKPNATGIISNALRLAAKAAPMVLLVDEAHTLHPELGRVLLGALQDAVGDGLPLLGVFAGTPELPGRFRQMRASFWERADKVMVGRFESDDAVREALSVPAEHSGLPIDKRALDLLVKESQRYPFFAQMVGQSAWEEARARQADARKITLADAKAGIAAIDPKREQFYEGRRKEIFDQGVLEAAEAVSAAMVGANGGVDSLSWKALEDALATVYSPGSPAAPPPWVVQEKLEALGLIWSRRVGEWEPGIPSLCSFLVRHRGRGAFDWYKEPLL